MSVTSDMVEAIFELVSGDNDEITKAAIGSNSSSWTSWQVGKAAVAGAVSGLIPVVSYITIPADVAYALRLMHRSAAGICAIELGFTNEETFAGVLAVWTGDIQLTDDLGHQVAAKVLAKTSTIVGGQVGVNLAVQALSSACHLLVSKKVAPKIAIKVAAMLGAQLSSKAATRWIPIVSAVASGGVNYWIVDGISDSALKYTNFIKQHTPTGKSSTEAKAGTGLAV